MQLVIPLYAIGLNATDAQVGLTRGILQFGGLLASLPGGFLVDRFGSKKIYILRWYCRYNSYFNYSNGTKL